MWQNTEYLPWTSLKIWRIRRGLTCTELADKIEEPFYYVYRLELGLASAIYETAELLANELRIPVTELLPIPNINQPSLEEI